MTGSWKRLTCGLVCLALGGGAIFAQAPPPAILEIDVVNYLSYESDVPDYSKLASDPNPTSGIAGKNFSYILNIGDIVAINGKPAKGTWVSRVIMVNLSPNPAPGQAIADITRANVQQSSWEILTADGRPVGTIFANGMGGGPAPPGAPLITTQGNQTIVGGTGAFLGVRGQQGGNANAQVIAPNVSVTEDPANRRLRKGGSNHQVLHLIPMSYPQVIANANGPLLVHASDYSPVTIAKPASGGEILTMIVGGLGPTRPGVDPGKPFPADQLYSVNSPVLVVMNGLDSEVLYAGGYPNTTNWYQVNFRVPSGVSPGMASLQVSAAWITGPDVRIAIK
jgi:uncharacterized protein (TIGR03437 family)